MTKSEVVTTDGVETLTQEISTESTFDKFGKIKENTFEIFDDITTNKFRENAEIKSNYTYSDTPEQKLEKISYTNYFGTYNNNNKSYSTTKTFNQSINYDPLGRTKELSINYNNSKIINTNYSYVKRGEKASNRVSSIWYGSKGVIKDSIKYIYDEKGNISKVLENGVEITRYTYDNLTRLIREDNKKLDKTYFFEYDKGGNIIRKTIYKYNLNNREAITTTATSDYIFYYPSVGWKDKLSGYMLTEGYSDTEYECGDYDELGNPWTYKGKALTWDNLRTLKSYDNVSFTYDKNGNRISKTISTISTDEDGNQIQSSVTKRFYFENNRLIMQDNGDNSIVDSSTNSTGETCSTRLYFHYGADGLIGVSYRNSMANFENYFYKKNAQGDIIGIYGSSGNQFIKYCYDAWGNCTAYYSYDGISYIQVTDSSTGYYAEIARLNPFRYRGYYYDTETNLYYLNSRYYDPETGRFINADDISVLDATSSVINGLNLYAYCLNNPVNETDESGYLIFSLLLAFIIGGTIAAGANVLSQVVFENKSLSEVQWGKVGISFLSAGFSSLIPGAGFLSIVGQSLVSSLIDSGLNSLFYNENFSIKNIVVNTITQIIAGYILKGISKLTEKITSKIFIKGINYSQYQHYFRTLGFDYSRIQVYKQMHKHIRLRSIVIGTIDYITDFMMEFITSSFSYEG